MQGANPCPPNLAKDKYVDTDKQTNREKGGSPVFSYNFKKGTKNEKL